MSDLRKRRTQGERSAETTAKILEATLAVLEEDGFAAASTASIARRAQVSRGALAHHFPSKFDLIVAAVAHLLDQAIDSIETLSAQVNTGEATIDDFLDRLWEYGNRRMFMISLDYLSAARTDDELAQALLPHARNYQAHLDAIWERLAANAGMRRDDTTVLLNMTLCLLRGMCLQAVLRNDDAYFQDMLRMWREALPHLMRQRRETALAG